MKLIILITALSLQVSASVFGQQISMDYNNAPLREVMTAVRKQSGYSFLLESKYLTKAKPVTIHINQATIEQTLQTIFASQPFDYTIDGKIITIKPKEKAIIDKIKAIFQTDVVTGKVSDGNGNPMPGVNVKVKGTGKVTLTDENGNYRIETESNDVLIFSYVGYVTKEVPCQGSSNINITLTENVNDLQETVIKGYYNTTKELNTGNASVVKSDKIDRQPVGDPLAALQGQVPGLFITQSTGTPGREFTVRLRGRNSIANGNDPLYIVDGVPVNSKPLNTLLYVPGAASYTSPLNDISTSDIESIAVLKDADATAIYGSRGANGVIIITTKRGKVGTTNFSIDSYTGIGKAPTIDLLNTDEYLDMRKTALQNDGQTPNSTAYDLNGTWDQNKYTDWQKVMIGGTAKITNTQGAISGGGTNTQFRLGGGYRKETTVFPGDNFNKKGNILISINQRSENKKFNIGFSGNYIFNNNKLPGNDMTMFIFLAPNAPDIYNEDGGLNWQNGTFQNPFSDILKTYTEHTANLIGNTNMSYEVVPGLFVKSTFGYNKNDMEQKTIIPFKALNPNSFNPPGQRGINLTNNTIKSWIIEPQISYSAKMPHGIIDALLGTTFQEMTQTLFTQGANGFPNDEQIENITGGTSKSINEYIPTQYRYTALYGRIGYNYKDTYLLNITGRRDGSSRFGPGKQFGTFGAVGAAWIFQKEDFIKDNLEFLSSGKLRMSIGTAGNDNLKDYKYLSTYSTSATNYQGYVGLNATQLTNPYYGWERVNKLEAGLDLGFSQDKVLLNISWYRHRTNNQLVGYNLPELTGFPTITANLPAIIENKGIEIEIATTVVKNQSFIWTSTFNLSIPKNKLISYPNIEGSSYANTYKVGEPLSIKYLYEYNGIDPKTGLYTFSDIDGDGNITSSNDRKFFFNGQKYYGGWNNSITWKDFQLNFLLTYVNQTGLNFLYYITPGTFNSIGFGNQPISVQNNTNIQPFSANYNGQVYQQSLLFDGSNARYTDASYIRMKTVSLSWSMPKHWKISNYLKNSDIYMLGQNLFTITHYKGLDPETQNYFTLPPIKMITLGLRFTL